GISREKAAEAVVKFPPLAGLSVRNNLKPKMEVLRRIGVLESNEMDSLIELATFNVEVIKVIDKTAVEKGVPLRDGKQIRSIAQKLNKILKQKTSKTATVLIKEDSANIDAVIKPELIQIMGVVTSPITDEAQAGDGDANTFSPSIKFKEEVMLAKKGIAQQFNVQKSDYDLVFESEDDLGEHDPFRDGPWEHLTRGPKDLWIHLHMRSSDKKGTKIQTNGVLFRIKKLSNNEVILDKPYIETKDIEAAGYVSFADFLENEWVTEQDIDVLISKAEKVVQRNIDYFLEYLGEDEIKHYLIKADQVDNIYTTAGMEEDYLSVYPGRMFFGSINEGKVVQFTFSEIKEPNYKITINSEGEIYPDLNQPIKLKSKKFRSIYLKESSSPISLTDEASTVSKPQEVGGIDFNPDLLDMQMDGQGIDFNIPINLENLNPNTIGGFTPVIYQIIPVTSFPALLGLVDDPAENEKADLRDEPLPIDKKERFSLSSPAQVSLLN
ncbi:MAG: hypothetical protein KC733_09190, partial [Candidatus Omnitrophica bacterium]|nr:hypothetical protein [Candidatus Omnitrophota bacterium]